MEFMISREVQNQISPFVYDAIFKKMIKKVKGYSVLRIWSTTERASKVVFNNLDPDPRKSEVFHVRTNQYKNDEELFIVLMKTDEGDICMMTTEEASSMVRKYLANHGAPNDNWKLVEVI